MKNILLSLLLSAPCYSQVVRQNGLNQSNASVTLSTLTVTNTASFTNGPVGIGTASPGSIFEIDGASPTVTIKDTATVGAGYKARIAFQDANGAERATIGTSGSNSDLEIRSENGAAGGIAFATQNSTVAYINFAGDINLGFSHVHVATMTATGIFAIPQWTVAQLAAYTPVTQELGGLISCTNCGSAYTLCKATGTTIAGFAMSTMTTTGQSPCR